MSTTTYQNIPGADDVRPSTPSAWRIASGHVCRGREIDGTYETTPRLVGLLVRVGVHDGETADGETYQKVECDLQTRDGLVSVGCNTSAKTSSITFAGALVQCAKGDLICVEAASASKPNRYGSFSTYANLSRVNPTTLAKTPIKVARDESVSMDERLETLLDEIRAHPAFAPRPSLKTDESPTELPEREAFDAECKSRDWPDSWGAPDEHLALANASLGAKHRSLSDLTADDWTRHLAGLRKNVKPGAVPKLLVEAVQVHRLAKPDEFDPFATD